MKSKRLMRMLSAGIFALALGPATAFAQAQVIIEEEPAPDNFLIQAGGGVHNFTGGLGNVTDVGGAWAVRGTILPRSPLGVELSYVGAMNPVDIAGVNSDILTSAGEAMVRANLMQILGLGEFMVEPYIGAGAGFVNHNIQGDTVAALDNSTNFAVPTVAGLQAFLSERIVLDGRVNYRFHFDDNTRAVTEGEDLQTWTATAGLGLTF